MFFILLILIALILAFYIFITWNFDYWFKLDVPSPASCVFFGDLPNELLRRQHVSSDIEKIYNEFKGKAPYVGFIRVRWPHLLILETEVIKDVLIRNFNSFCNTELSKILDKNQDPLHAQSLFGLKNGEWKEKRTEIMAAFTNPSIQNIFEKSQENIENLINLITDNDEDEPFEAKNLSRKLFLEIIARAVYDVDSDEILMENEISLNYSFASFLKIILTKAFPFLKDYVKIQFSKQEAHQHFLNLTRMALEKRLETECDDKDFIDFLCQLKNSKNLSNIDLASHSIPFLSHGLENLSIALSHALYEIAKNDRVQEKLRFEIERNFDKDGKISFDSFQQMLYLDQVFYESLRLHPPVMSISRVCSETIGIEFQGKRVVVEEGINVKIPIMQIHHDSDNFMEPKKFHPERLDYTLKSCLDGCILIPFGGGPRSCLGKNLASNICKLAIAMIVKNFKISVNEKTCDNPFVIDPNKQGNIKVGGVWFNFKKISS